MSGSVGSDNPMPPPMSLNGMDNGVANAKNKITLSVWRNSTYRNIGTSGSALR